MKKIFINAEDLLRDSFKLAKQVYESNFKPDFIIGVWRGGAPVGIAIQEYFDYAGIETDHIAIRTSSYIGINQQQKNVQVHGLDYLINNIGVNTKVLLVDDVFDSGHSIAAILNSLAAKTGSNMPHTIKTACPWYKPKRNQTNRVPDYYINVTDEWLVFPHELKGLSHAELALGKPLIADLLPR